MEGGDFSHRVCVQAAAHICRAVGCQRAYPSVLDTIADVMKHYIGTIGTHAHAVAAHGGRSKIAATDVLAAMKQMGPDPVDWRSLRDFALNEDGASWQQPFHAEIPRLPVKKRKRNYYASVEDEEEDSRPSHIPSFLPPLPPKHSFHRTKVAAVKGSTNSRTVRSNRVKRKQLVQRSLSRIAVAEAETVGQESSSTSPWPKKTSTDPSVAAAPKLRPAPAIYDSENTARAVPNMEPRNMSREDKILEGLHTD
mmetsp:Transcript_2083/g.2489  ORF Transcript_2083/g.2489 Transcript_2083/m.2489 type:complete len:252 (-) Transcript_2083:54-809(-)